MIAKLKIILKHPAPIVVFLCILVIACSSRKDESESTRASTRAAQPVVIADAHVHHGLSYEHDKLVFSGFDYFEQRNLQIIGYPMPIKRVKTNNLAALIKTEIEDLHVFSRQCEKFRIPDSRAGLEANFTPESVTSFLSIEYFYGVFGGNPETVDEYRDLGIGSITLIDNHIDRFFSGDHLTLFGKQVIRRMNEAKILVDIAHLSEKQAIEVIRYSNSPVISSHSAARSVSRNKVSLSDEVLDTLKEYGGYVFVTFNRNDLFLKEELAADGINKFIEHVVYLTEKLGVSHVGIGTDYQAMGKYIPGELNEIGVFQTIQKNLREIGFSEEQIRSFSYGAFLSAMGSAPTRALRIC